MEAKIDAFIFRFLQSLPVPCSPVSFSELLSQFLEDGLNACILGVSDSGKTYLAKALDSIACVEYRVSYNRCNELL